ncbi:enoyl-CoA hydratase/isomerase family protein [Cupriavidus sp. RAF12]|uniref:enoyl-CoA hydratase/isomerase family protein n=1 Tax=Cupriavidus sp. RAF12 TaxID=3233050 RepID=UPI003F8F3C11
MTTQQVFCSVESGVATITLDNPPVNVVTLTLSRQLGETLDTLAENDDVRAVILRGAGTKAFCAGSDIGEFIELDLMSPGQVVPKKLQRQNDIFFQLESFPKPTVAAVEGLAFGGGLEIALCCDLIVASATSRVALPEIKLGVFPSSGGTVRATRRIGSARAKEMIFLGEPLDAATALSWGLINRVAPAGRAYAAAQELCATLTRRPRHALALSKSIINMSFDAPVHEVMEASFAASDKAFSSPECAEGVRAFFAKETPNYEGI